MLRCWVHHALRARPCGADAMPVLQLSVPPSALIGVAPSQMARRRRPRLDSHPKRRWKSSDHGGSAVGCRQRTNGQLGALRRDPVTQMGSAAMVDHRGAPRGRPFRTPSGALGVASGSVAGLLRAAWTGCPSQDRCERPVPGSLIPRVHAGGGGAPQRPARDRAQSRQGLEAKAAECRAAMPR